MASGSSNSSFLSDILESSFGQLAVLLFLVMPVFVVNHVFLIGFPRLNHLERGFYSWMVVLVLYLLVYIYYKQVVVGVEDGED